MRSKNGYSNGFKLKISIKKEKILEKNSINQFLTLYETALAAHTHTHFTKVRPNKTGCDTISRQTQK